MRAHAAGEALGAGVFADMCLYEIIGELTWGEEGQRRWDCDGDRQSMRSEVADSNARSQDLAASSCSDLAVWVAGQRLAGGLVRALYRSHTADSLHLRGRRDRRPRSRSAVYGLMKREADVG
jgi:hypothetical protein